MTDAILKICPNAVVKQNCKSVIVLVPEDFDKDADLEALFENSDLELLLDRRTTCEVWSRVMGYLRPISGWNAGKQSEYADRVSFSSNIAQERFGI